MSLRALSISVTFAVVALSAVPATAVDTWSTPHPGIRLLRRTTTAPIRAFAAEIDMCTAGVSFRVTRPGERRQRPSAFGAAVGAELAVNGDFFNYSTYSTSGLSIGDGAHWEGTADSSSESVVAFGNDRVEIPPANRTVTAEPWMNDAVGGHPQILRDGTVLADGSYELCTTRHPRTAVGLSADGRKLYIAVVDGRSTTSRGMRCSELGAFLKELGADDGLNLDGGGSSAMWVRGQGVVNRPSDGTERVVANHLAVIANGGTALPEACNEGFHDAAELPSVWEALAATTDVDGDGIAEVCGRGAAGVDCHGQGPDGLTSIEGPRLADDSGWTDPSNYNTIRWGDLNGDGLADMCARANARVQCWLSDGAGFPTRIDGPELADDVGWAAAEFYSTLRIGDFTGDGLDDLCVRSAAELRCYPSNGAGFDAPILGPAMPGSAGWGRPGRFGTLRMGDVDGDGAMDLCARRVAGMVCWPSDRTAFGEEFVGPAWSNDAGFLEPRYWTTIRLVDVDADGRADLCARTAQGLECHLSTGRGFGEAIAGPPWSDASGWDDPGNFATIRFGDIDGDRDLDVCGRSDSGVQCFPWDGAGFGGEIPGPQLSDDTGWGRAEHLRTIRLADFDGDGRADLCGRAGAGWRCWPSNGGGFDASVDGPEWSNAAGWRVLPYWSTIAIAGPRCIPMPELCNQTDDDCDGLVDEDGVCAAEDDMGGAPGPTPDGGMPDAGGGATDGGAVGAPDTGAMSGGATVVTADGGCCSQARAPAPTAWWLFAAVLLLWRRRR